MNVKESIYTTKSIRAFLLNVRFQKKPLESLSKQQAVRHLDAVANRGKSML